MERMDYPYNRHDSADEEDKLKALAEINSYGLDLLLQFGCFSLAERVEKLSLASIL